MTVLSSSDVHNTNPALAARHKGDACVFHVKMCCFFLPVSLLKMVLEAPLSTMDMWNVTLLSGRCESQGGLNGIEDPRWAHRLSIGAGLLTGGQSPGKEGKDWPIGRMSLESGTVESRWTAWHVFCCFGCEVRKETKTKKNTIKLCSAPSEPFFQIPDCQESYRRQCLEVGRGEERLIPRPCFTLRLFVHYGVFGNRIKQKKRTSRLSPNVAVWGRGLLSWDGSMLPSKKNWIPPLHLVPFVLLEFPVHVCGSTLILSL